MNHCFKIFFFFLTAINLTTAQELVSKTIDGKIMADSDDLEGIYIVNLKTDKSTITSRGGYFSIYGSVGDTLLFSAVQFKGLKLVLKGKDLKKELLLVNMEVLMHRLEEVKIMQYPNINSVSLGLVPANQKQYSPAERKLNTAKNLYATGNVDGSLGGSFGADPILNWISGRTKMLEKVVQVEKKEFLLKKIDDYFSEKFFIEKLKIPEENIKGFQYYLVEDEKFVTSLNAKNKTMAKFLIGELAVSYLNLLNGK